MFMSRDETALRIGISTYLALFCYSNYLFKSLLREFPDIAWHYYSVAWLCALEQTKITVLLLLLLHKQ